VYRSTRTLIVCLALAFLGVLITIPSPITAAQILSMEFHQLSFAATDTTPPTENSSLGEVEVTFGADEATGYLNILARLPGFPGDPVWIVRNLLLHDATVGAPEECLAPRFPLDMLGVEPGMPVMDIEYGFTVTPLPILDSEFEAWAAGVPLIDTVPVTPKLIDVGRLGLLVTGILAPPSLPTTFYPPFTNLADSTVARILGCLMPNVDLHADSDSTDRNGCVPAGCANSLTWLRTYRSEIDFPGSLRDTYDQLSRLMNRNRPKGVWPEDMMRAKLDFIEAYNLPIEVKFQNRWPRFSPVRSTSGYSAAADSGAANTWPSIDWIKSEIRHGEDVEINVSYWYSYRDTMRSAGAHCVVVTGAGRTAGSDWLFIKHDADQSTTNPAGLAQVPTGVNHGSDGAIYLPGLEYVKTMPDNSRVHVWARLDAVISESPKTGVPGPPASETFPDYCHWFARTIPPGGALVLDFPDTGLTRCYNVTVWRLDRTITPPWIFRDRGWNFNRGKRRTWRNDYNYPVTVWVHNDDHSASGFPVGVSVAQTASGPSDPDNTDSYGGFSLGGVDGFPTEFSSNPLLPFVDIDPLMPGFSLSQVPARLAETGSTSQLHLFTNVMMNPYWEHLGLVIDVLDVTSPGVLNVDCLATGFTMPLFIDAPGRYEVDLGTYSGSPPTFELMLTAMSGLDMTMDSLGVPSLVPVQATGAPGHTPARVQALRTWPNPFNPTVNVTFRLNAPGEVELAMYDLRGHRLATLVNGRLPEGEHTVTWNGRDADGRILPAGVYICRLFTADTYRQQKVTLVK